jgi:hypothetical protein
MPARSDIEPGEIAALLPYLSIFLEKNGEIRYRLAGTAVVSRSGAARLAILWRPRPEPARDCYGSAGDWTIGVHGRPAPLFLRPM